MPVAWVSYDWGVLAVPVAEFDGVGRILADIRA